jgi:adenylate cyclase
MPNSASGGDNPKPASAGRLALRALWGRRLPLTISFALTFAALAVYLLTFVGEKPTPIFEFINRLELDALDTRFRIRPARYSHPDSRIVVVDIDQRSQEILGRWPFSRAYFAQMLDALHEDGSSVVAFDVTFSKADESSAPVHELTTRIEQQEQQQGVRLDPRVWQDLERLAHEYDTDDKLAQAIRRDGPIVLGNFFLYSQADLEGVSDKSLDQYANILSDFPLPQERASNPKTGQDDLVRLMQSYAPFGLIPRGTQANIPLLSDALRDAHGATGFFNVEPDPDGVVRHSILVLPYGRSKDPQDWDMYGSLDLQAVRLFLQVPDQQMVLDFGPTGISKIEFGPSLSVQPDPIGRMMINYLGPVRTYKYVSIADVVNRKFAPGTFRGKIVLVGASATGIGDLRSTPYAGLDYPGVEIHANVIDNILNQHILKRGGEQVFIDLGLILLFGIPVGIWLALSQPRWLWFGALLLMPFTYGVYFAFLKDWWLNFTMPALTLVSNVGLVALYRALTEAKETRRVRGAFQQYLSPEVIRRLLENPALVRPHKTEISVMFTDVRGFTSISERLDAQELAALLNEYLTDMTQIVFRNNGTLDKYIGDAVMAFWGAPFEEAGHAERACFAALEMMERLALLQKKWEGEGKPRLDIGIGLNTGVASVGNMGSELRYGYTAMGDSVNLASRLEGLNKEYVTHIVVSESTFQAAANSQLIFRELDLIRVKGKTQPVTIYELLGARNAANSDSAEQDERVALFAKARANYQRRRWPEALALFEQLLARWPSDGPARIYKIRCEEYLVDEPEASWDGVFTMAHK